MPNFHCSSASSTPTPLHPSSFPESADIWDSQDGKSSDSLPSVVEDVPPLPSLGPPGLAIGNEQYLEMVERIAEATPPNLQDMVTSQLTQLNCMTVPALTDAAAITLQGDQYRAYATVTQNIQASRHQACYFFVTGPGGTRKSFLLKSLQHWCDTSRNSCVLLAPTCIAARNIDGETIVTIHSGMSIYYERGSYHTGLFNFNSSREKARESRQPGTEVRACRVMVI
jgi:PIF1-like helicase